MHEACKQRCQCCAVLAQHPALYVSTYHLHLMPGLCRTSTTSSYAPAAVKDEAGLDSSCSNCSGTDSSNNQHKCISDFDKGTNACCKLHASAVTMM